MTTVAQLISSHLAAQEAAERAQTALEKARQQAFEAKLALMKVNLGYPVMFHGGAWHVHSDGTISVYTGVRRHYPHATDVKVELSEDGTEYRPVPSVPVAEPTSRP